jgi:RND family efflux transporter MFP subunit
MSKKKLISLIIIITVVIVAVIQLKKNHDRNTVLSDDISYNEVTVSTTKVVKKNSSIALNLTGTLYPFKELDVAAGTEGKITSLHFTLGESVQPGTVLAVIDDKAKQWAYESAKVDAKRLKKDYERTENLYNGGTASEQEFDNARTSYETAKNKLDEAEKQFADTKVRTSIGGTITAKKIEDGAYVKVSDVIASVVDISRLKVKLNVSESNVYNLKVKDNVRITADVYPGVECQGTITFISSRGDDSHNYPVEIEMPNSVKNPLKAGTFVSVAITVNSNREGLFIPREALQGSVKDAKVYVAENNIAVLKSIIVGEKNNDMLEVVGGLDGSDVIIVSGQVSLTNGKAIKIINNK